MDIRARSDIAFRVTLSGQQPDPQNRPLRQDQLPEPSLKQGTGPDKVSFSPEARRLEKASHETGEARVEMVSTDKAPRIFTPAGQPSVPLQSAAPRLAIQSNVEARQPQSEPALDAADTEDLKSATPPTRQRLNLHI